MTRWPPSPLCIQERGQYYLIEELYDKVPPSPLHLLTRELYDRIVSICIEERLQCYLEELYDKVPPLCIHDLPPRDTTQVAPSVRMGFLRTKFLQESSFIPTYCTP